MFEPYKQLGQNFLTDFTVASKMVSALQLSPSDTVVEIGPGLGIITRQLANDLTGLNSKIYAVEIDERFIPNLNQMFSDHINAQVVFANILDWLPNTHLPKNFKILGALPFNITTPIIKSIIFLENKPSVCVLMVQDEVAIKLSAVPPDASYWSVFLQSFFNVEYLGPVKKEVFDPKPMFDGGLIKLTLHENPFIQYLELNKYEKFLNKAFSNPRKMLNKIFTAEELSKFGFDPSLRAENISAQEWIEAFKISIQK